MQTLRQAGAKKVYAVEATYMAQHAERAAAANGFKDVVQVLQGKMEEIELPEKVRNVHYLTGAARIGQARAQSVIDKRTCSPPCMPRAFSLPLPLPPPPPLSALPFSHTPRPLGLAYMGLSRVLSYRAYGSDPVGVPHNAGIYCCAFLAIVRWTS